MTSPQSLSISSIWPGASGIYKYSRDAVRLNAVPLLVVIVVYAIVTSAFNGVHPHQGFGIHSGNIVDFFLSPLVTAFLTLTWLAGIRGKEIALGKTLSDSLPYYLNMLVLNIISTIVLVVSFLLLIVPFFFVAPRLALAPYFVVDKKMNAFDALKASWETTKGNVGKVYGIVGLNIAICLLFITIIGIPFALYFLFMYGAAFAVLYEYLKNKSPQAAKQ